MGPCSDLSADTRSARLHSPVPGVGVLVLQDGDERVIEDRSHVVEQRRLVAFQGHDVACSGVVQQRGAGALNVQGAHRHVASAQVQQPKQLRECGDLVGRAIHGDLADAQAHVSGERVQQVKGWDAARRIRAALHGLAVDGDGTRRACGDTPGKVGEQRLELVRPDEPEQPPKASWDGVPPL